MERTIDTRSGQGGGPPDLVNYEQHMFNTVLLLLEFLTGRFTVGPHNLLPMVTFCSVRARPATTRDICRHGQPRPRP